MTRLIVPWTPDHGSPARRVTLCLAAVLAASLVGQLAILHGGLHPQTFPDSREYLALAHAGHGFGRFFDTKRTPGYPVFLGLVAVAGGKPTAVEMVQVLVVVLTSALAFRVATRLSGSLPAGVVAGILVGANPWGTQWEQAILTEALATLLLLLVAGLWIRLLAAPGWRRAAGVGAVCCTLVLVRPAFLLIAVALAAPALWSSAVHRDRRLASGALVMLGISYLPVAGYAVGNAVRNSYQGISTTSNVDVFGVTYLDLGLVPRSPPPGCAALAPLAVAERGEDPYAFLARHPQFESANEALVRSCGTAIIRERPLEFVGGVGARFFTLPAQAPVFYLDNPRVDTQPFKRPAMLFKAFRAWVLASYVLAAAGFCFLVARRATGPVMPALVMVVIALLVTVAALGPTEFYRLRAPLDPLVTTLAVSSMWMSWRNLRKRRSGSIGRPWKTRYTSCLRLVNR